MTWDNGAGLVFTRTISVDTNYMFTVHDAVKNTGSAAVSLSPYGLISRTGTPQVAGYYILFEGMIGHLDGSLREVKYASLKSDQPENYSSTGGWLGFTDKYWLTALIPPSKDALKARFTHTLEGGVDRYQTDFTGTAITVPAGGMAASETRFFAGAKEVGLLDSYAAAGIRISISPSISVGSYFLYEADFSDVANSSTESSAILGLSILLLTFIIKLLILSAGE